MEHDHISAAVTLNIEFRLNRNRHGPSRDRFSKGPGPSINAPLSGPTTRQLHPPAPQSRECACAGRSCGRHRKPRPCAGLVSWLQFAPRIDPVQHAHRSELAFACTLLAARCRLPTALSCSVCVSLTSHHHHTHCAVCTLPATCMQQAGRRQQCHTCTLPPG